MAISETFEQFLRKTASELVAFSQKYLTPLNAFLSLSMDPEKTEDIIECGLTVDYINASLDEILTQDCFLHQCCGDIERLAYVLDILFFSRLPPLSTSDSRNSLFDFPNPIDQSIAELETSLYGQGPFEKKAFFHLFNFDVWDIEALPPPPYSGWTIEKQEWRAKAQLLGENTLSSFLSPPGTGDFFLVVKDSEGFDSELLGDWLNRRWHDASPFCQILQYAKDAIVDIDYVVPYFNPPWVNQVQRGGLYYLGTPRQDKPPENLWYLISPTESETIELFWGLHQKHAEKFTKSGPSLRKAIGIAGDFYEDGHKKVSRIEQFADLIIALEALYTPSDQAEQTFRISQSCAVLLGNTLESRESTFEFLRAMFKKRGKLFHGQHDPSTEPPEKFINNEDLKKLISIVRNSILRFVALLLRGENDLIKVRKDIERAILDETFRCEFLEKTDYESLLSSDGDKSIF
ncbi:hypothetical protein ACTRXD_16425 [Nitrospira sp. T9]|uniref:hypothetical protein n=1 Tax=unclassified Nitrospira TaxID=2652172 RepID=UPI003F9C0555